MLYYYEFINGFIINCNEINYNIIKNINDIDGSNSINVNDINDTTDILDIL